MSLDEPRLVRVRGVLHGQGQPPPLLPLQVELSEIYLKFSPPPKLRCFNHLLQSLTFPDADAGALQSINFFDQFSIPDADAEALQ